MADREVGPDHPHAAEPDTIARPESRPLDRSGLAELPGQSPEDGPESGRVTSRQRVQRPVYYISEVL